MLRYSYIQISSFDTTNVTTVLLLLLRCFTLINTLKPRKNGYDFPDDILKWIFLIENAWVSIKVSLKFVPKGTIDNNPVLVQIMAWRRPGDKPLSESMMPLFNGAYMRHLASMSLVHEIWFHEETRISINGKLSNPTKRKIMVYMKG